MTFLNTCGILETSNIHLNGRDAFLCPTLRSFGAIYMRTSASFYGTGYDEVLELGLRSFTVGNTKERDFINRPPHEMIFLRSNSPVPLLRNRQTKGVASSGVYKAPSRANDRRTFFRLLVYTGGFISFYLMTLSFSLLGRPL